MADFAFRHFQGDEGTQRLKSTHDTLTKAGWEVKKEARGYGAL